MAEKIKRDVDGLLLVSKLKRNSIFEKYIEKFLFLSSLPFTKFLKTTFYVIWKQTCRNVFFLYYLYIFFQLLQLEKVYNFIDNPSNFH